jgi:hypothetical protein
MRRVCRIWGYQVTSGMSRRYGFAHFGGPGQNRGGPSPPWRSIVPTNFVNIAMLQTGYYTYLMIVS